MTTCKRTSSTINPLYFSGDSWREYDNKWRKVLYSKHDNELFAKLSSIKERITNEEEKITSEEQKFSNVPFWKLQTRLEKKQK